MITPDNFDSILNVAEALYNASETVAIWPKVVLDKADGSFTNKPGMFTESQQQILKSWKYLRSLKDQKLHRGKL